MTVFKYTLSSSWFFFLQGSPIQANSTHVTSYIIELRLCLQIKRQWHEISRCLPSYLPPHNLGRGRVCTRKLTPIAKDAYIYTLALALPATKIRSNYSETYYIRTVYLDCNCLLMHFLNLEWNQGRCLRFTRILTCVIWIQELNLKGRHFKKLVDCPYI